MDELDGEWTQPTGEDGPDPDYARATRAMEEAERRRHGRGGEPPCGCPGPARAPSPAQAADALKAAPAYYLMWAMGPSGLGLQHDLAAQEAHLAAFLAEAGSPADPVERLLLQQLHLAHHAAGRLHVRAGTSECPQAVIAFLGAAARLTAELASSRRGPGGLPPELCRQEGEGGGGEESARPPPRGLQRPQRQRGSRRR